MKNIINHVVCFEDHSSAKIFKSSLKYKNILLHLAQYCHIYALLEN